MSSRGATPARSPPRSSSRSLHFYYLVRATTRLASRVWKESEMDRDEMLRLFEAHREAEAARDLDAILETFVTDCFLETMPLGLRSEGRDAIRAAYELQFFTSFPDLAPEDEGMAVGDDVTAVWGRCAEPAVA